MQSNNYLFQICGPRAVTLHVDANLALTLSLEPHLISRTYGGATETGHVIRVRGRGEFPATVTTTIDWLSLPDDPTGPRLNTSRGVVMTTIAVVSDKTLHTEPDVVRILGFPVTNVTRQQAVERVRRFLDRPSFHHIVVANTNKFWLACHVPGWSAIFDHAEMVIPEYGPVWASRVLGTPLRANVRGIGLLQALLPELEQWGEPVYFLGARQQTLELLLRKLRRDYPRLRIAGSHHGFFPPVAEEQMIARINKSGARILFAGMGSPRQELWIEKYRTRLLPRVAMGVGGSFDALAGVKREAPAWTQCGLEWLYRLCQDPRLWKRYLRAHPWFMWHTLCERITGSAAVGFRPRPDFRGSASRGA